MGIMGKKKKKNEEAGKDMIFELYLDKNGNRKGPIFKTADRALAAQVACAIGKAATDEQVAMLMVDDDNCILNEKPDWRHPDFSRVSCEIPLVK